MELAKKARYLKLLGIDTFALREGVDVSAPETLINESPATEPAPAIEEAPTRIETPPQTNEPDVLKGLNAISKSSQNGLLVVFTEQGKDLTPEARSLLSKMLKAIGYQAGQTGYAVSSETETLRKETLKGLLVFGKEAGDAMVLQSGARRVPGEDFLRLDSLPVVTTLHPAEILDTPALKGRAWNDLKLLTRLMNEHDA